MSSFKKVLKITLISVMVFIGIGVIIALAGGSEEGAGQSSAAVSPEVNVPYWQDALPALSKEEIVSQELGKLISIVHENKELTDTQKVDTIFSIAEERTKSLNEQEVKRVTQEILTNIQDGSILDNKKKKFLLEQVYHGAVLTNYFDEDIKGHHIGLDYYQVARDLYRGTAERDSDFIKSNLQQIEEMFAP